MIPITQLPHAARVLARAHSQQGQSTARAALDGSGAGCGRGLSRAVGDDSAAQLVLDGSGLCRQRATAAACSLSTGRSSQASPRRRLKPIALPELFLLCSCHTRLNKSITSTASLLYEIML